jgi:hypothetical protein
MPATVSAWMALAPDSVGDLKMVSGISGFAAID